MPYALYGSAVCADTVEAAAHHAERILGTGQFAQSGRTFHTQDDQTLTRPFGLGSESGSGGRVGAFALAGALALASRFRRMRHLLFSVAMAIGATAAVVAGYGQRWPQLLPDSPATR